MNLSSCFSTRRLATSAALCLVTAIGTEADMISITAYNDNLALVRDTRHLSLEKGANDVRLADVAALIDPTSVLLSGDGVGVVEQNFEFDLADGERILQKYLDRELTVVLESGDVHTGRLVSHSSGSLVLVQGDRTMALNRERVDRIDYPELPGGLTTKPTLVWTLNADRAGDHDVTLSYLTRGVSWHAEYVALVNEDDTALELNAWVSLENTSGATYDGARLQLVAGTINRAQPERKGRRLDFAMGADARAPEFEEESFFEYHLYTLDTPVTVKDRQTKQVALFPAASVGEVEKRYVYRGGRAVQVRLEFENAAANGLGLALPKGVVRVYKADSRGGAQLVGEDRIAHTPRDERVELVLGNAFDITGERTVKDVRQIGQRVQDQTVEIVLRNHKDTDVTVKVEEQAWGDWSVTESTHPYEKESATLLSFEIPVESDGETTLTFTLRTQR